MRAELIRRIFVIFLEKHQEKNHHSNVKSKMLIPAYWKELCVLLVSPQMLPPKRNLIIMISQAKYSFRWTLLFKKLFSYFRVGIMSSMRNFLSTWISQTHCMSVG